MGGASPSYVLRPPVSQAFFGQPLHLSVSRTDTDDSGDKPVDPHAFVVVRGITTTVAEASVTDGVAIFPPIPPLDACKEGCVANLIATLVVDGFREVAACACIISNPLKSLVLAIVDDEKICCVVELHTQIPDLYLVLVLDGVDLRSEKIPHPEMHKDYDIPLPRLSGLYAVSIRCGPSASFSLDTKYIQVDIPESDSYNLFLLGPHDTDEVAQSALVSPGTTLSLRVHGTLHAHDSLAIIPLATSGHFQLSSLKLCSCYVPIDEDGSSNFTPIEEGIYTIALCLGQEHSQFLVPSYVVVLVSALAPTLRSPPTTAVVDGCTSVSSQITPTCVVCCERPLDVKLEPCRHVCMCLLCAEQMMSGVGEEESYLLRCPMCRKNATSLEQVFL